MKPLDEILRAQAEALRRGLGATVEEFEHFSELEKLPYEEFKREFEQWIKERNHDQNRLS